MTQDNVQSDGDEILIRAIDSVTDFERSMDVLALFFEDSLPPLERLKQWFETACHYGYNQFIAEAGREEAGREEAGREVVGSISIKPVYDPLEAGLVYEINHLIVKPDYRRMGIGSALMEKCHSYARHHAAIGVRLLSYNNDEKAQAFYSEKGYIDVCHVMIKPLH